ncbi:MAG: group II intron reverse transcriptase domain-containing protein [Candidatus Colwellbacteria bacterium]|nr:group II intron reverse transcriptase domain-containing protein [Candidatus Colwellbacteria bacterium]
MRIQCFHNYEDVISLENLLLAWQEFVHGKRNKADVQVFGRNLIDNLIDLHNDLTTKKYRHGGYEAFTISDPKPRNIHKASVRDRVLHHAICRLLYPFFDFTFVHDSYSCRVGKGTHKALNRFRQFSQAVSQNHTRTCWVLKCDIKKFFASIDQHVLLGILQTYITDKDILWLLQGVIGSFYSTELGKGLPLGNLTSQLLVNIYMNELDQFVKHKLKARHYIRYADDFVLMSRDKKWLEEQIPMIESFLNNCLALRLHPDKVSIQTVASGVDFLGWVHFPHHRVPRPATVRRMRRRIATHPTPETIQSYAGLLSHGNAFGLRQEILGEYGLWESERNSA